MDLSNLHLSVQKLMPPNKTVAIHVQYTTNTKEEPTASHSPGLFLHPQLSHVWNLPQINNQLPSIFLTSPPLLLPPPSDSSWVLLASHDLPFLLDSCQDCVVRGLTSLTPASIPILLSSHPYPVYPQSWISFSVPESAEKTVITVLMAALQTHIYFWPS